MGRMQRAASRVPWSFWPVFGVLLLLPFGRSSEAALLACAIVGVVALWRRPVPLVASPGLRLALLLVGLYVLAALLSAADAVAPDKSWSTVAGLLRFLPFVLGMIVLLPDGHALRRLYAAIALLVGLWLLDAWVQAFTGWSLGGADSGDRLSGIFGADNLKLGPVLAVLSPFVLATARRWLGTRGQWLAAVLLLGPILLAGSRAAWLMFALVLLALLWRQTRSWRQFALWLGAIGVLGLLAAGVAWRTSPDFEARAQRTLKLTRPSVEAWNTALAGRLSIWFTSARMVAAHPVNGVGVRGFRYAYPDYAAPGDQFVALGDGDTGAFHAHQWVLEVLTETGIIGLVLWCIGIAAAFAAWRRAGPDARERAFPVTLALAVMLFPLNTHYAFYSAWWGLLFWWLLALWCAAISGVQPGGGGAVPRLEPRSAGRRQRPA